MPHVHANGLDIAYEAAGTGPPLILLHGASSSGADDFGAQLPLFGRGFRCHAPDARGHAGTRWDAATGFRYDWLVDDVIAFADALGLGTFHLLGFSMGAATALGVAARVPDRLRTLVLVGISMEREPRASVARRLFDPARIHAHDPRWAEELARRHDAVQGRGAWERLLPAIASDVAAQPLQRPEVLVRIDAPVLVACGDRDPFVPVGHAWRLKRQLPDARLLVVPDCGHEVMLRRPALFNEALAGFYRSTEATAVERARRGAPKAGDLAAADGGPTPGEAVPAASVRSPSPRVHSSARADAAGPTDPATDWLREAPPMTEMDEPR